MGKVKLNLKGDVQDLVALHEHLTWHTKKITKLAWIKQPEVQIMGEGEAEFQVTI